MDESQVKPAAVVELLGRDGRVLLVQRVTHWPARIGRSPACDIVLDDSHLAPEHAELDWLPESGARLRMLDSVNGGSVGAKRLGAGEAADLPAAPAGANFQLGACPLRLRTSADTLAPESRLVMAQTRHWALLPGLILLMLALQWVDRWTSVDPDARWIDYASPLLGPLAFVLGWAGLWSLATQLFQHRFPFATHLRRALVVICGLAVFEWLLPLVAYAFSWPRLLALDGLAQPIAGAFLVAWHARLVWPNAKRTLSVGIAALLLLGLGLQVGNRQEQQYVFGPPYLASLPPPAFRIAGTQPPDALIESLKPLKTELSRQARKDEEGADEESD